MVCERGFWLLAPRADTPEGSSLEIVLLMCQALEVDPSLIGSESEFLISNLMQNNP